MPSRLLRIAIVDESAARAAVLAAGLREAGLNDLHIIGERFQLLRRLTELSPDVVLIDLESPSRDVLDEMSSSSACPPSRQTPPVGESHRASRPGIRPG